jgi:hypothetical protein
MQDVQVAVTAESVNSESPETVDSVNSKLAFANLGSKVDNLIQRVIFEAEILTSAVDDLERALDELVENDCTPDDVRNAAKDVQAALGCTNLDFVNDVEDLQDLVDQN